MALPVVIAKNQTGTPILLPRLGVACPASPGTIVLTDEANFFEVASEEVLEQRVSAGDIVINDGTVDLSTDSALAYLNATGNMNGPVGAVAGDTLIKLDGSTGRYTKATGIAVDTSNNLTNVGTINGFDVSNFGDLPALQLRRSTTKELPLNWEDISFDIKDVENDASVLEHDTTTPDRIDIKENGLYLIAYQLSIDADSGEEYFDVRVRSNDTTVLDGSLRRISEDDEVNAVGNVFVANLVDGSFLSFQIQADGTGNILMTESTYVVIKLQGAKGNKGDTGSGSNITVQDEGTSVTGTPHDTLNFVGSGVTVTNAGGGAATVTVPGSAPNIAQYRNTAAQTINTSSTTLSFNATDYEDSNYTRSGSSIRFNVAGIYKVSYTINWDTTNRNRRTLTAWAELDGVEIVPSRSNDYARNSTDDTGSNTAVFFTEPTLNQDLTLVGQSTGTSGSLSTFGNQVWVTLEYVRAS